MGSPRATAMGGPAGRSPPVNNEEAMASLIEAIDIKRKMFFEFENAPYRCIDVDHLEADRTRRPDARAPQDAATC